MKHVKHLGIGLTLLAATFSSPVLAQPAGAGFGSILTQILNEIKVIQNTLLAYYADKDDPKNLRPASPDIDTLNKIDKGLAPAAPNQTFRLANNNYIADIDAAPPPNSATWQAIDNILRTSPDQAKFIKQYMSDMLPKKGPQIDKPYKIEGDPNMFGGGNTRRDGANPFNKSLSLNSLLQPQALKTKSSGGNDADDLANVKAVTFIRFATGQAQPLMQISQKNYSLLLKTPDALANYLSALRNYAALASVGISNFNYMLAQREVPKGDADSKSQVQLQQEMATRRFGDGKTKSAWRKRMETASPVVLQREMLYLLADMNYQLHQNHLQQERILATMSAMQLQQLETTSRSQIESLAANVGQ